MQRQFLVEAILVTAAGGLAGIAVGYLMSTALARAFAWPTDVSASAAAIALAFAAGVGLFFGWYPARAAAGTNPIEALRFE